VSALATAKITLAMLALQCAASPARAGDVSSGLAALNRLCRSAIAHADNDEALRVCHRVGNDLARLAPGSTEQIASLVNIGDIKTKVENFVDADAYYSAALKLTEKADGPQSAGVAALLATLVETKVTRGKFLDAEALMKRLLATREAAAGADDPEVALVRLRHADMLAESHQFPEAELAYTAAVAVLAAGGAATVTGYADGLQHLAELYERRAQYQQAERQYRLLLHQVEQSWPASARLPDTLARLAYVCDQQDKRSEAEALYRRALAVAQAPGATTEIAARIQTRLAERTAIPLAPTPPEAPAAAVENIGRSP
jgi:tetratricopeptide (TPR) repeat protein